MVTLARRDRGPVIIQTLPQIAGHRGLKGLRLLKVSSLPFVRQGLIFSPDDRRNGAGTYDRSRPNGPHHYPPAHSEHDTYTRTRARSPSPMRPHETSDSRPAQKKMRESYDDSQGWSHSHPHSHYAPPSSAHSHPPTSAASSTGGGWPGVPSAGPPTNGPNGGVKDYRSGNGKESWTRPNVPASYDRPVSPGLDRYGNGGGQSAGYGRPPPGPANTGARYGRGPPGRS